jgi:hypothetical protein
MEEDIDLFNRSPEERNPLPPFASSYRYGRQWVVQSGVCEQISFICRLLIVIRALDEFDVYMDAVNRQVTGLDYLLLLISSLHRHMSMKMMVRLVVSPAYYSSYAFSSLM